MTAPFWSRHGVADFRVPLPRGVARDSGRFELVLVDNMRYSSLRMAFLLSLASGLTLVSGLYMPTFMREAIPWCRRSSLTHLMSEPGINDAFDSWREDVTASSLLEEAVLRLVQPELELRLHKAGVSMVGSFPPHTTMDELREEAARFVGEESTNLQLIVNGMPLPLGGVEIGQSVLAEPHARDVLIMTTPAPADIYGVHPFQARASAAVIPAELPLGSLPGLSVKLSFAGHSAFVTLGDAATTEDLLAKAAGLPFLSGLTNLRLIFRGLPLQPGAALKMTPLGSAGVTDRNVLVIANPVAAPSGAAPLAAPPEESLLTYVPSEVAALLSEAAAKAKLDTPFLGPEGGATPLTEGVVAPTAAVTATRHGLSDLSALSAAEWLEHSKAEVARELAELREQREEARTMAAQLARARAETEAAEQALLEARQRLSFTMLATQAAKKAAMAEEEAAAVVEAEAMAAAAKATAAKAKAKAAKAMEGLEARRIDVESYAGYLAERHKERSTWRSATKGTFKGVVVPSPALAPAAASSSAGTVLSFAEYVANRAQLSAPSWGQAQAAAPASVHFAVSTATPALATAASTTSEAAAKAAWLAKQDVPAWGGAQAIASADLSQTTYGAVVATAAPVAQPTISEAAAKAAWMAKLDAPS